MVTSPKTFRPSPIMLEAITNNGGGRGTTHRLSQISDRYLELLRRANLPAFSDAEFNALTDVFNGTINEPAAAIRGSLWIGLEHSLPDGVAEKWGIDAVNLIERLKQLTFVQEIVLIERIEAAISSFGE